MQIHGLTLRASRLALPLPPAAPAGPQPAPVGGDPPGKSPLPVLIGWFVIPLAVILLLDRLGVFTITGRWIAGE